MNEKLLQTAGRDRERIPATGKSGGFLSLHQLEKGKLKLSDMDYCTRFGQPAHFAGLRKLIEADRDKIPAFTYWKCEKPSCLWKAKMNGDKSEGGPCLRCNMARFKDGSWMKRMDKKEAEAFDKAESERAVREIEQLTLMEFNRRNTELTAEGHPPLTLEQFKTGRQAEYQLEQERRTSLTKSFSDRKKAQELKEAEEKVKP